MPVTVRQAIDDALEIIGEVSGPAVQTFDDDRMKGHVRRAFNLLFKKFHWPQYCQWFRVQLANGFVPANTFVNVLDFEDFIAVYRDGDTIRLPRLPKWHNPYSLSTTQLRYWSPLTVYDPNYEQFKLQFYPATSTDFVNVKARVSPKLISEEWLDDDLMYFDRDLLAQAAAYMGLIGDDLNSNAAEAAKALMETRFKDIVAGLSSQEIPLQDQQAQVPNEWYPAPP